MRTTFIIRLALINTFKKRLRVILTVGGITLTSSIIVLLFGIQSGLRQLIDHEIKRGQSLDVITVTLRDMQNISLDASQVSKIKSMNGVSNVSELVGLYGNASYHDTLLSAPIYAVSPMYFSTSPSVATQGSLEAEPQNNGIILSSKALSVFDINPDEAIGKALSVNLSIPTEYSANTDGQEISTTPQEYIIKGIIDRGDLPVIYLPIDRVKEQGLTSVSQLNVQLTSAEKSAIVREAIEQLGLQTSSIQDTIEQINKLFTVIQNFLYIFSIIVLVITVSATFITITMTLVEETKQIGFLRIMGLPRSGVKSLFIIQSIIITSLGALFGIILGLVLGFVFNGYAKNIASSESFSSAVYIFTIPVSQVIIILVLSLFLGWLVGIAPAKRAVLINPLEELES